jgi:hypothetical protein
MDVGKGLEGVFGSAGPQLSTSYSGGSIAFLASDGSYLASGRDSSSKALTGKVETTDDPWTYEEGYAFEITNWVSSVPRAAVTSGTYFPFRKNSLFGAYSLINALAVTASSVDGSWYSDNEFGTSFKISVSGDTGAITGITGGELNQPAACAFRGTISLHERNSSKNLYDMTLTIAQAPDTPASEAATCEHTLNTELKGFAAITFDNTGTQDNPVYAYALDFAVGASDSPLFRGRLTKQ